MRTLVAVSVVLLLALSAAADEPATDPSAVRATIDRGLAFLAKDAIAWKSEHNCTSCHHAGPIIWSMREAKQRGIAVDEPVLAELTKWIAESGDGKTGVARPPEVPRALNEKAVNFALALAADPAPDDVSREGMKRLLQTVESDQVDNGSWNSWPDTRPPIFGNSDERTTALATLALLPTAASGDEAAKAARDKGVAWLERTTTDDDPQSIALRVVLWQRLGRPAEQSAAWVERIRSRQNVDGGWSQTPDMASDAWATGQALYALAHAASNTDDSAIQRGRAFLVKTQRDDGSWPMTSRPTKPGGEGSKSLIPIVGAGSAWAVLGLVRSQ
jgi:hypothetical protein